MTLARRSTVWLVSLVVALAVVHGGVGMGPERAIAGPDQWTDVVAPYVHLSVAIPPATGPLSTLFLVRRTKGSQISVRVQCFNDDAQFVGPLGQPFFLGPVGHQTFTSTPEGSSLGLTSHPNFTGVGWCYFSSVDKFAVEVAWGFYGGPVGTPAFNGLPDNTQGRMFSSNASVGVGIAVGQTTVADGSTPVAGPPIPGIANVPTYLLGNWFDALLLVNPTASSGQATVAIRNCSGCSPAPAPTTVVVPLPARGMGVVVLSDIPGAFFNGNATISTGALFDGLALGDQRDHAPGDLPGDHAGPTDLAPPRHGRSAVTETVVRQQQSSKLREREDACCLVLNLKRSLGGSP